MPAALADQMRLRGVVLEMPRYFFHVRRGDVTVFDREGVELTGIAEAAREAARSGDARLRRDAENSARPRRWRESSSKKDGAPSWSCHSAVDAQRVNRRCGVGARNDIVLLDGAGRALGWSRSRLWA